jgi:uncharacterized membrane protein YukC
LKNPPSAVFSVFLVSFDVKFTAMIAVNGTYQNGVITLEKKIRSKKSLKVIVTFLDEELHHETKRLTSNDFSFKKSREKSQKFIGSLSESVIDERKSER